MSTVPRLIVISGRSGSGKSAALHALEDQGFYCVDNLPADLLPGLIDSLRNNPSEQPPQIALSIDARNIPGALSHFASVYREITEKQGVECDIIFLDADDTTLLKRYSSTRRRHPLSNTQYSLEEAIKRETDILEPISLLADLRIDTSTLSLHDLRSTIRQRVLGKQEHGLSLQLQSFGFKHGIPTDADYVFDVRCLPNPYWDESLRHFTGMDEPVIKFLQDDPSVKRMIDSIYRFIESWLKDFEAGNRSYMTIAIGCTGGQHRSVFVSEALAQRFRQSHDNTQIRHREIQAI
ncbi:RNase adapter RapZ [Kistimonas scapharcae]|uniref:RNase adapter RapZ n=1 Tax=Kistimonas scapharcae TaxID=1036133 RepID=A0ABP8UW44_9GAMM